MRIPSILTIVFVGVAIAAAATAAVAVVRLGHEEAASARQPAAVSALGVAQVGGRDVLVDVLVAVQPGQAPREAALAALRGQGARPVDTQDFESAAFSVTGLFWDVFSDGDPGNDQVLVQYNDKGVPGNLAALGHRSVWLASQATWTDVATSNFAYADGGDTGRCPSLVRECKGPQKLDGKNDIGWLNIADPSVLGVTWFSTSADEFDMALDNKDFLWYSGSPGGIPAGAFDVETVWLHEFGHGLGLGHSSVQGAVMEPFYAGVRRSLHQDDIDGVTSLYPAAEPTPTPTVTPGDTATATPTLTPTPSPTPSDGAHVGDLDGESGKLSKGNWKALVTVEVHDAAHAAVAGATVSGEWTNDGLTWAGSCVTDAGGRCVVDSGTLPKNRPSASFTVVDVSAPLAYEASANHDPDGDSDGTTISVSK